jgi:hypothetical protein
MGRHTIIKWGNNPAIDWSGQTAVIVASGPSVVATDFELLRGQHVIAVNLSWQLVPWAEVLYASDGKFWFDFEGVPQFAGRKVTSSPMAAQSFGIDVLFTNGNNSGSRAIHLAETLGARRVLLLGYDMHIKRGTHWHAPYSTSHNPTEGSARVWRDELNDLGARILKRGIAVINCTPGSALKCFPQLSLNEALNGHDGVASRTDQSRDHPVPG